MVELASQQMLTFPFKHPVFSCLGEKNKLRHDVVNHSHLSLKKKKKKLLPAKDWILHFFFPSPSHETSLKPWVSYPAPYFLQLQTSLPLDEHKKKLTNLWNDCGMVH